MEIFKIIGCQIYFHVVPYISVTTLPSDPIQGAMVGSPQDIQCIVSTVSGVELSSVMISWIGPGGESITNDSRVTISPTTYSGSSYTSSLQFTYLMEGDEGIYTCNVMILEASNSDHINMQHLTSKSMYSDYVNLCFCTYRNLIFAYINIHTSFAFRQKVFAMHASVIFI